MAKITVHGGPSDSAAEGAGPSAAAPAAPVQAGAEEVAAPALPEGAGAELTITATAEVTRGEQPTKPKPRAPRKPRQP